MIKQIIFKQLINCYQQLFNDQDHGNASFVKPEYMWWDMEKAVDSTKFNNFLKD